MSTAGKLNNLQCKNAKFLSEEERKAAKRHNSQNQKKIQEGNKLSDGGGLFLHVKENGKYWRMNYSVFAFLLR